MHYIYNCDIFFINIKNSYQHQKPPKRLEVITYSQDQF